MADFGHQIGWQGAVGRGEAGSREVYEHALDPRWRRDDDHRDRLATGVAVGVGRPTRDKNEGTRCGDKRAIPRAHFQLPRNDVERFILRVMDMRYGHQIAWREGAFQQSVCAARRFGGGFEQQGDARAAGEEIAGAWLGEVDRLRHGAFLLVSSRRRAPVAMVAVRGCAGHDTLSPLIAAWVVGEAVMAGEAARRDYARGRLRARPRPLDATPRLAQPGERRIEADGTEIALLLAPQTALEAHGGAPLLLLLHGARRNGAQILARWHDAAEEAGLVVLAPHSAGATWDVLIGGYGRDVERVDDALGQTNGDLFAGIVANSPGFCWPPLLIGRPRILITHGTQDAILPIDLTGKPLAIQLERAGYDVVFHEYDGGHALTPEVLRWSLEFMGLADGEPPAPPGADA